MSTNNNNNEALAPAATARPSHLLPPTQPLGSADNTGLFYIHMCLSEMLSFGDDDIGSFNQVTPQHVEVDNLEKLMNGFYCWLANSANNKLINKSE